MKKNSRNAISIIILLYLSFPQSLFSQINTDSIFNIAIQKAKEGAIQEAIDECKNILDVEPNRNDVMNFLANIYGWQQNFEEGNKYIQKAWKIERTNQETYATHLNLLLWSESYQQLLKACDEASKFAYQNELDIFQKRITALRELKRFDELNQLIGYNPEQIDIETEYSEKKENVDSIIQVIFKYTDKKLFKEALQLAQSLGKKYPERTDIVLLTGNLYAWQNKFDSAKVYVNKILSADDTNKEAYSSLMNILLWNKEYEQLLYVANLAEVKGYDDKYNLTVKRALAMKGMENYEEALALLEGEDVQIYADSADIKQLKFDLTWLTKKRAITFFYALDFSKEFKPHHLAFVEWANKFDNYTLALRMNYAYRYGADGIQFEADMYRPLKKKKEYLYLNYGIGFNNDTLIKVFPNHRIGLEYYFPFDKNLDGSIGGRYLVFTKEEVFILTGHIGTMNNNNWFAFRPFITFIDKNNAFSFVANFRKFGEHNFDFFGLEFGYGTSPDERFLFEPDGSVFQLRSYRIKAERNFLTKSLWEIRLSLGYMYEEFQVLPIKKFRHRYLLETLFRYRL